MIDKVVLSHKFVDLIPDQIDEGIIYISIDYTTIIHKCCCGCGKEIVTPISPTDWILIFDGKTISVEPSIGNWNLPCQSHYWINHNKVIWARKWSQEEINAGRYKDFLNKARYYQKSNRSTHNSSGSVNKTKRHKNPSSGIWKKLKNWFF